MKIDTFIPLLDLIEYPIVKLLIVLTLTYFFILFYIEKYRKQKINNFEKFQEFITCFKLNETKNKIAYVIENGFYIYSGKILSLTEISFLLDLENNALHFFNQYIKARKYLMIENNQLVFRGKYQNSFFRYSVMGFYFLLYGFCVIISTLFSHTLGKGNQIQDIEYVIVFIILIIMLGIIALIEFAKVLIAMKLIKTF